MYFVEPQTRENRRMDIVITFGSERYVIELKIWRGRQYEQSGIEQLAGYLDIQGQTEGYLINFKFGSADDQDDGWISAGGKKIYMVTV